MVMMVWPGSTVLFSLTCTRETTPSPCHHASCETHATHRVMCTRHGTHTVEHAIENPPSSIPWTAPRGTPNAHTARHGPIGNVTRPPHCRHVTVVPPSAVPSPAITHGTARLVRTVLPTRPRLVRSASTPGAHGATNSLQPGCTASPRRFARSSRCAVEKRR
jgi:hypothetical protein